MLKWGLMRLVSLLRGLQVSVAPESTQEARAEGLEGGSPWRELHPPPDGICSFGCLWCPWGEALGYYPHH